MKLILHIVILLTAFTSCTKEFLDKNPDKKLVIPKTEDDYLALLEDNTVFDNAPYWGEWNTDNLYVTDGTYSTINPIARRAYTWENDVLQGEPDLFWNNLYNQIYLANLALEGMKKLEDENEGDQNKINQVKGMALYLRGEAFYNLSQYYCKPYNRQTASQDLGIPLRLSSNLHLKSTRATVEETYNRIIQDLTEGASYLKDAVEFTYKNRPSKPAVYGLLARTYLVMNDFENAKLYTDKSLQLHSDLIDYNTLAVTATQRTFLPVDPNIEMLVVSFMSTAVSFSNRVLVTDELFSQYNDNDLRKSVFFGDASGGAKFFRGQYYGLITNLQTGPCTDEMYLIRAECNARLGNKDAALTDLNTLMEKRWNNSFQYTPFIANDAQEALGIILIERRKELCFRGLRWSDLRRLNQDPSYAKTLQRTVNGQTYSLPPNDPKYVLQIPDVEIQISGIEQNLR